MSVHKSHDGFVIDFSKPMKKQTEWNWNSHHCEPCLGLSNILYDYESLCKHMKWFTTFTEHKRGLPHSKTQSAWAFDLRKEFKEDLVAAVATKAKNLFHRKIHWE